MTNPELETFSDITESSLAELGGIQIDAYKNLHQGWKSEAELIQIALRISSNLQEDLFHLAFGILLSQLDSSDVRNNQGIELMHPVWSNLSCGVIYVDVDQAEGELIEAEIMPIKDVAQLQPFTPDCGDIPPIEHVQPEQPTFFHMSLLHGATPKLQIHETPLALDRDELIGISSQLLTTLTFTEPKAIRTHL